MKKLITREYNGVDVHFEMINGESYVSVDDVARFCGWTRIKSGKEYVMWDRVNNYLSELSFHTSVENDLGMSQEVATGDFIQEYIMYPLIGKANNEKATQFMLWVGKVISEIRQTGSYTLSPKTHIEEVDNAKAEMQLMGITADILHFSDNSKLMLAHEIYKNNNISEKYLPSYTESKGILKPPTELLKQFNVGISARKFNLLLLEHGIIRECERKSTKDKNKTKKFKNLVDTYWGENQTFPKNPKETQPMYYQDKFEELLKKVNVL